MSTYQLTPLERRFISIYKCIPEVYYAKLCEAMDARAAACKLSGIMDKLWIDMKEENRKFSGLAMIGFEPVQEGDKIPFQPST